MTIVRVPIELQLQSAGSGGAVEPSAGNDPAWSPLFRGPGEAFDPGEILDELADRHRRLHPGVVGDAVFRPAALGHPGRAGRSRSRRGRAATAVSRAQIGIDERGGGGDLARDLHCRQFAMAQLSRLVRRPRATRVVPFLFLTNE